MKLRLVSELYITVSILLTITLCSAGLTFWSIQRATQHFERTNIAYQQYEGYLILSNHTYQLFKQFGDSMLIGDQDNGKGESKLISEIREDIKYLRRLIGTEIEQVDEEETDKEIEELHGLAMLERMINSLLQEYQSIIKKENGAPTFENWEKLSYILDEAIDNDFSQQISAALEDESSEVLETRHKTLKMARYHRNLALIFALVAVIMAVLCLSKLMRDIRKPLDQLLKGTSAIEHGDFEYRVKIGNGPVELDELGQAFNKMAIRVSSREQALIEAQSDLQHKVEIKTADLTQALETLTHAEATRKRLLSDVSHELRTPLTIIRGEADIALRGKQKSSEEYRDALVKCRESADHTARIVDDLLTVARGEAGEIRLISKQVDLAVFLPHVIDECESVVTQHGAIVSFASKINEAVISADEQRLQQVMLILLENAARYGGTMIEVRLERAIFGYAIILMDNGPGMTSEEISLAFDRFFRGSNAAVRYGDGAGLGLPIAKTIVEAHTGTITLDSEPGKGMTVSVILPNPPQLKAIS